MCTEWAIDPYIYGANDVKLEKRKSPDKNKFLRNP